MTLSKALCISIVLISCYSCNSADPPKEAAHVAIAKKGSTLESIKVEAPKVSINQCGVFEVVAHTPTQLLAYTSLSGDLRSLVDNVQRFAICASRDTGITCKEGTNLSIKAGSFVTVEGQSVITDSVFLEVKEFYKTSDILLAGLSTHSNDKVLETGGMIFIEAYSNGKRCDMQQGSTIDIGFPYQKRKDSMQLFTGAWNDQQINWLHELAKDSAAADTLQAAEYPGGHMALSKFLGKHIKFPESLGELDSSEQVFIEFEINEKGNAVQARVKEPVREEFKSISLQALAAMPAWKPATKNGMPVTSYYKQRVVFRADEDQLTGIPYQLDFEAKFNDSSIQQANTAGISQYIFSTSKLGWINCDRYYRERETGDLYVECGEFTDIDIKLVFHSIKSILQGTVTGAVGVFRGIPINKKVTVVLIKKVNSHFYIALSESNTKVSRIKDLVFEEVTMEKLKRKLEQLNSLTN